MDPDAQTRLLEPLSTKWIENKAGCSRDTVAAWRRGRMPRKDHWENFVAAYTAWRDGLPEIQNEEAAPSLTRRLLAGVIALERRAGVTAEELSAAQGSVVEIEAALEADARIAAELEASQRRSSGRAGGQAAAQSDGSQGSKRRKP